MKSKINKIVQKYKSLDPNLHKTLKRVGEFSSGHLYGLPKIHKSETNPPLRPLVNMSGTDSHEVTQLLNVIIKQCLNTKYVVRSSEEFLVPLEKLKLSDIPSIFSLDVSSLFTNVPVTETIELIHEAAYGHQTIRFRKSSVYPN